MLIDTHCHLDAPIFDLDRKALVQEAQALGVACIVIPAVSPTRFEMVRAMAHGLPGVVYALGIHPWFLQPEQLARVSPECADVHQSLEAAVQALAVALHCYRDDPRLVAVGEIGLDAGVPGLDEAAQQYLYTAQLKLARDFDLPVLCHVHKAQDQVLKGLRRFGVKQGIAHAFNGSVQQAHAFLAQGFKLGFGGALTYSRAQRVRKLALELPLEAIVLETDAPDQPPAWCRASAAIQPMFDDTDGTSGPLCTPSQRSRNTPVEIIRIAHTLAELRAIDIQQLAAYTTANAYAALPRLKHTLP